MSKQQKDATDVRQLSMRKNFKEQLIEMGLYDESAYDQDKNKNNVEKAPPTAKPKLEAANNQHAKQKTRQGLYASIFKRKQSSGNSNRRRGGGGGGGDDTPPSPVSPSKKAANAA